MNVQERRLLISVEKRFDTAELEESDPFTDVEEDEDELENELVLDVC